MAGTVFGTAITVVSAAIEAATALRAGDLAHAAPPLTRSDPARGQSSAEYPQLLADPRVGAVSPDRTPTGAAMSLSPGYVMTPLSSPRRPSCWMHVASGSGRAHAGRRVVRVSYPSQRRVDGGHRRHDPWAAPARGKPLLPVPTAGAPDRAAGCDCDRRGCRLDGLSRQVARPALEVLARVARTRGRHAHDLRGVERRGQRGQLRGVLDGERFVEEPNDWRDRIGADDADEEGAVPVRRSARTEDGPGQRRRWSVPVTAHRFGPG